MAAIRKLLRRYDAGDRWESKQRCKMRAIYHLVKLFPQGCRQQKWGWERSGGHICPSTKVNSALRVAFWLLPLWNTVCSALSSTLHYTPCGPSKWLVTGCSLVLKVPQNSLTLKSWNDLGKSKTQITLALYLLSPYQLPLTEEVEWPGEVKDCLSATLGKYPGPPYSSNC